MSGMEAVIIAGGLGSRLWPLTTRRPKHLLPVANLPLVAHQLHRLASAGVEHVVLATSYRAAAFEPVLGDGSAFGIRLTYVTESEPLGTGGAIRNALPLLGSGPDDPVLVLNGDQMSDHDLAAQVRRWCEGGADVSLQLVDVPDPRQYGCVPTDSSGRVTAFREKSPQPSTHQVNAGSYVFRCSVIADIPTGTAVSVERETFPRLLCGGRVVLGYAEPCYWLDVGTPATLVRASRDLVTGALASAGNSGPPAERLLDPEAHVEPSAQVRRGTSVGPRARIGHGSEVEGSVVMAGAVVGAGARVVDSIVGAGARLGPEVVLVGAVVGDEAVVGERCELGAGARVACEARLGDGSVRFSAP